MCMGVSSLVLVLFTVYSVLSIGSLRKGELVALLCLLNFIWLSVFAVSSCECGISLPYSNTY